MSRRRRAEPRAVQVDPRYHDELISKFINSLMRDGKKSVATRILYGAMDEIREKNPDLVPVEVVRTAIEHVKPTVEVKSRRVGGSTYQVPMEVRPHRRQALSIRWLIRHASTRSGLSMRAKLAGELLDAFHNRGGAVRRREEIHRTAEANRAFAHYRW